MQTHLSPSATRSVHNSRKTQLYTYKACKSMPSRFHICVSTYCNSAHNSRKQQPYIDLSSHLWWPSQLTSNFVILHSTFGQLKVDFHSTLRFWQKAGLHVFTYCDSAHSSKKKQHYSRFAVFAFSRIVILHTVLRKNSTTAGLLSSRFHVLWFCTQF